MGAPRRPARRLSAALAAFLLLTLAAALAPQAVQAQQSCGTLSTPTVSTASGAKQLTVSWGALSAGQNLVGSWELRYRKTGASNWITRTVPGASVRSIVLSGLEAATTYQVQLQAIHQTGTCPPSSSSAIATGTTLSPLVLTVTPGDEQVGLSWTWNRAGSALPNAWVYRQKQGSGNYGGWLVMTGGASARSFTVTGLNNGTAYTFQIARQVAGPPGVQPSVATPYSNEVTVTPTGAAAPVLTVATSTSLTSGSKIDLTWTHAGTSVSDFVSGAASFYHWEASHRLKGATDWTLWSNPSQAGGTARRTASFVTGDRYPNGAVVQVRVRARGTASNNASVYGPWSNTREVTYQNDDLSALTLVGAPVTVTQNATATYTVALTKAYAGTLRITSGATGKATVEPATLTFTTGNYNTAQTVTVTGVAAGQATINHAFRLTGASADAIPDAGTVSVTVEAPAAAPVLTVATSTSLTSGSKIDLTWTHAGTSVSDFVSGAASFYHWEASHRLKGATDWTLWSNPSQAGGTARRTASFVTGDRYPNGAVVQVRVRARGTASNNASVYGPWSNTREVTYQNDDLSALTLVGAPVTVTQNATATYTVALTKAYAGTLRLTSGATGKATVEPATLTFTTGNYNTAQTVTVTGVAAGQATINHAFRLTGASADAIPDAGTVSVTVEAPAAAPVLISDPDKRVTAGAGGTVVVCYNLLSVAYDGTTYLEKRTGRTAVPAHSALKDPTNGVSITQAPAVISAQVVGTGNVNFDPCATVGPGTHTVTWEWNGPDGTASKGTTSTTFTVVEAPSTKTLALSATSTRITEGDSGHTDVTVTITLGEPAPEDFTALISAAGDPGTATEPTKSQDACEPPLQPADTDWCFLLDSAAVAIAEGETEETVKIRILGDTRDESNETIILHVSSEEPGWTRDATLTLTIVDDDGVTSPAAPPGFRASAGDRQVTLNWNDPNDATITGYQLRYAKTGVRGNAAWAPIPGSGIRTLTYTVRNLDNDAEYSFRVRAVNSAGNGTATTWVTATPTATPVTCPTAQPPTALSVTPGADRLSLTWTAPTQAERNGWQLQYRKTGGSWTAVTVSSAGATSYTISGLEAGTAYQVRLQATVGVQGANCPGSAFATAAGTTTGSVSTPPTPSTPISTPPPGTPRAKAGAEIEAAPGARVRLDGSGSTDPDGGELRYAWRQVLGWSSLYHTAVELEDPDTARPSFTAPGGPDILVFRLTVTDPEGKTDTASVWVTVRDEAPTFGDASVAALDLAPDVAMTAVVLPEATGGNGALTYTLTSAPRGLAGLAFDPATRRLSGTPTAESGRWMFTYRADDVDANRSKADAAVLTFEVTVRDEAPTFGDASVAALALVQGAAMTAVVLPEATGGNGALTYTLTSEPAGLAGLSFDLSTRRLSGTPSGTGRYPFTYRADDADANRSEADAAILTFEVSVEEAHTARLKQTVRRTLVAVAHRALTGALDQLGARMAAEMPMNGLTLAGETVPLSGSGAGAGTGFPWADHPACAVGAPGRDDLDWRGRERGVGTGIAHCGGLESRSVESDELLNASAFSLSLGAAEGEAGFDPQAPRWAVWGRGDYGTFAGRPDGMHYDGEMRTGWLGVDARAGAWVAGLAVSHGLGEADYGLDGGETGRLETDLTAVYPYGRWTVSEGGELRGVLGAGWGEARHRLDDGAEETSDLTMRMASLGLRHALPPVAGLELAVRAEASAVRLETDDGPDPVHGLTADSWRLRTGLEASWRFGRDDATSLTPFVEAAARRDGGDGLTGTGLEIVGGVRWTAPRGQVEARGRWLVAHTEDGVEEQGVSVTARVGPGAGGRGLSLRLSPRWGAAADGAEALWRDALPAASTTDPTAALEARLGWGIGLRPAGLLTPFVETGWAENDRRLRLGGRFDADHADLAVELAGEHREGGASGPEQTIRLDLRLRF